MRRFWPLLPMIVLSLGGCSHPSTSASDPPAAGLPVVCIATPTRHTLYYTVEQPGRVEPFEQTPIFTKIAGYVRSVRVEIGDRVKRGDLLVELDVPELVEAHRAKQALVGQSRLAVLQAQRSLEVIQAALATAHADIEVSKAAHQRTQAALQRWRSEYNRIDSMVREKVVDAQSRDEYKNQTEAATAANREAEARIRGSEASLKEAQAKVAKAKADLEAAQNQLTVAQAQEREALAMLAYSKITAPFDGVIADRQVHTGHFLNAATGATTGHPLLVVVRMDKVRVFVEVPEADAVRVAHGNSARIRVQTLNDREFEGQVAGTSWSLDPSQRTLRTEIDLPNPQGVLRPGMYVKSLIDIVRPDAWVIPASAVLIRDGVSFCYELRDGKTLRLPLRQGLRDGDQIEVLKFQVPTRSSNLPRWINPTGAEEIIVTHPGELLEGQSVRAVKPADGKPATPVPPTAASSL